MSEGDKEKDTDRVEPLEVKPGGKMAGTMRIATACDEKKRIRNK